LQHVPLGAGQNKPLAVLKRSMDISLPSITVMALRNGDL